MPRGSKYRFIKLNLSTGRPEEESMTEAAETLGVSLGYLKAFVSRHYNTLDRWERVEGCGISMMRSYFDFIKQHPIRSPINVLADTLQPKPFDWKKLYIVGTDEEFLDELVEER